MRRFQHWNSHPFRVPHHFQPAPFSWHLLISRANGHVRQGVDRLAGGQQDGVDVCGDVLMAGWNNLLGSSIAGTTIYKIRMFHCHLWLPVLLCGEGPELTHFQSNQSQRTWWGWPWGRCAVGFSRSWVLLTLVEQCTLLCKLDLGLVQSACRCSVIPISMHPILCFFFLQVKKSIMLIVSRTRETNATLPYLWN